MWNTSRIIFLTNYLVWHFFSMCMRDALERYGFQISQHSKMVIFLTFSTITVLLPVFTDLASCLCAMRFIFFEFSSHLIRFKKKNKRFSCNSFCFASQLNSKFSNKISVWPIFREAFSHEHWNVYFVQNKISHTAGHFLLFNISCLIRSTKVGGCFFVFLFPNLKIRHR